MASLSVCGVSRLSVGALSGQFVGQAVDGFVVGEDGTDVLLEQSRESQTHTVNLQTGNKRVSDQKAGKVDTEKQKLGENFPFIKSLTTGFHSL